MSYPLGPVHACLRRFFLPVRTAIILATGLLAGCGTSPPVHYHALTLPGPAPATGGARMLIEVLPVGVPERLNREEMVLSGNGQGLNVLETDRWAAPLADEIRQVLADGLWQRLQAADDYRMPVAVAPGGLPQYRLALRVERFDAEPGRVAVVEAVWTVRRLPQGSASTCRAGVETPLPDPSAGAAAGALALATGRLTEAVAASIERLAAGAPDICPERSPMAGG